MSILTTVAASKAARVGVAAGLAGAALVASASSSSAVAAVKLTVAPATGANTGATLTVNGSGFTDASGGSLLYNNASGIQFNSAVTCPAAPATAAAGSVYDVATKAVISGTRLVVTAPSMTLGTASAPKAYQLCVYRDATTLLGSGKYTVYAPPTITSITPAAGASLGRQSVTVVGTGFTKTTTASVGGTALTDVKVAADGLSLTGKTPAHAAGAVGLTVTTEGGPVTTAGAYTFANAITVTPQTGVVAGGTVITIKGVGFNALAAGFAAGTPTADVVFSRGVFNPVPVSSVPTNPALARCTAIQVVSDSELVCTAPSVSVAFASGVALTAQVVSDPGYTWAKAQAAGTGYTPAAGTYQTVVSSASTFTFSAF